MLSSGYVALGAFVSALQVAAAAWAIVLSLQAWLSRKSDRPDAASDRLESRTYLAALLGYLLLGLSLISWLVFYLVLDSFVPQWPGAMCIYGITQFGRGMNGAVGWLPTLISVLQSLKPLLVFTAGGALVLYHFYRRLGTRTLLPRVASLLFVVAVFAMLDAATELSYLAIPKYEKVPSSGCCSALGIGVEEVQTISPREQVKWQWSYYGCHLVIVGLLCHGTFKRRLPAPTQPLLVSAMALVTFATSMHFLVDVASPRLLHLPYHRCLYDLVPGVPESGVALGFLLWGTFCVGWGAIIACLGRAPESVAAAAAEARRWYAYALVGYAGSVAMLSLDLWLA
jgi:hypothetical protein